MTNKTTKSGSGAHKTPSQKATKSFLPYVLTAVPLGLALAWLCSPSAPERPAATTAAAQQEAPKTQAPQKAPPASLQDQTGPQHRQHRGPVCSGCPQERWQWDEARDGPTPTPVDDGNVPLPAGEGVDNSSPTGPAIVCNTIVAGLDQLVKRADRIVVGRVIGSESLWNKSRSMIYTYYTVEVQSTLKGPKRKRVKVRVVGGKVGETEIVPSHVPEFTHNDLGLIFIIDDPTLFTSVVGAHQGFLKFKDQGPDNGFAVVDGFGRPIYGLSLNDRFIVNAKNRPQITDQVLVKRIRELNRAG